MTENRWYFKFRHNQAIEALLKFSQAKMALSEGFRKKDHPLLGEGSRYWDWPTPEMADAPCIKSLLTELEDRHQVPVNTQNTRIALWEYASGDYLPPHTDLNVSLSATIVVSLVGQFETRRHDLDQGDAIVDRFTYGPGEYIILNNTVVRHSGKPLDAYRLGMVIFIDPAFDMTDFWRM